MPGAVYQSPALERRAPDACGTVGLLHEYWLGVFTYLVGEDKSVSLLAYELKLICEFIFYWV